MCKHRVFELLKESGPQWTAGCSGARRRSHTQVYLKMPFNQPGNSEEWQPRVDTKVGSALRQHQRNKGYPQREKVTGPSVAQTKVNVFEVVTLSAGTRAYV